MGGISKNVDYDKKSVNSIHEHAKKLLGRTLTEVGAVLQGEANLANKGRLGQLVETHYFNHRPPNDRNPDFPEAHLWDGSEHYFGLELKVTGLKRPSNNKLKFYRFQAKERLVLTDIDYSSLENETWETSHLLHKCRLMLILFYFYEEGKAPQDLRFVEAPRLQRLEEDLEIIRRDWETIREKIKAKKHLELSEGDTNYLGACVKGGSNMDSRFQSIPGIEEKVRRRAFALKASYVSEWFKISIDNSLGVNASTTFQRALENKFEGYLGNTVAEIGKMFDFPNSNTMYKSYLRDLANRILGGHGTSVAEIQKAGIEMKTLRLIKLKRIDPSNPRRIYRAAESMSFRNFDESEFQLDDEESAHREREWEESGFFESVESRFLFIVFREDGDGVLRLHMARFWNMPHRDREECRRVWNLTKEYVLRGVGHFPRQSESQVAHVRPKARNKADIMTLPGNRSSTQQSFWLNSGYIESVMSSLCSDC